MELQMIKKGMRPHYFEGTLQLRNPSEEIFSMVLNQINHDAHVWIAKEEFHREGVDLYLSSNKFLLQLGKKLKKSFKGKVVISRRLFTQNKMTSKFVYRMTVLFRADLSRPPEVLGE